MKSLAFLRDVPTRIRSKFLQSLLSFFTPPPPIERIQGKDRIDKEYSYWRWRVFYSMFIGYAFYYFTRKSFTFAMPSLVAELGYDKAQVGFVASILAVTYGISKFTSGILADRSNPRYFMAIGLILTGVFNILFGLSSSLILFAIFWGLNGWFQGFGWTTCARLLTHWYSQSERGTWWGFASVSHNVGGALIPIVAAWLAHWYGWRMAMFVPGAICICVGFFLMNRLRDTPQSLGLPPVEEYKNDPGYAKDSFEEKKLSTKESLVKYVISNSYIWLLGCAYFFIYIIRTGFNDWTVFYLVEAKGYTYIASGTMIFWFEVGGVFGMLFSGWASDYFFGGRRGPMNILFSAGIIGMAVLFYWLPYIHYIVDTACMFGLGFLIFGPQMLIGMAASELAPKNAAATANGFVGWFAYIGAASAGLPLGKITQEFGWTGFFWAMIVCSIVATVLLLPFWSLKGKRAVQQNPTEPETTEAQTA